MQIPLINPRGYATALPEFKKRVCNGTGAAGTPKPIVKFLDNLCGVGLNVRRASNRHDWGYFFAATIWGKILADIIYFINICILAINACLQLPVANALGNLLFLPLRIIFRAGLNFIAVLIFGWFAWTPEQQKHKEIQNMKKFKLLGLLIAATVITCACSGCKSIYTIGREVFIDGVYANGDKIEAQTMGPVMEIRDNIRNQVIREKAAFDAIEENNTKNHLNYLE